jgi:flagellar assembly protein FliH
MQSFKIKIPHKPKEATVHKEEDTNTNIVKEIIPEIEYYRFEDLRGISTENFDDPFDDFETPSIYAKRQFSYNPKKKAERPVFSGYYTIKNLGKPVQLSLRKVNYLEYSPEELQEQIQSAYERGFQDGQQTTQMTFAEEFSKFEEWIRNIDQVTEELTSEFHRNMKSLGRVMVCLGFGVAGHIINTEVRENAEIVEQQVKKALDFIDNEQIFEIRLNPQDIEILNAVRSRLAGSEPKLEGVVLVPDSSISPGGCIVESSVGRIDATFESQLKKIQENLENINLESDIENV